MTALLEDSDAYHVLEEDRVIWFELVRHEKLVRVNFVKINVVSVSTSALTKRQLVLRLTNQEDLVKEGDPKGLALTDLDNSIKDLISNKEDKNDKSVEVLDNVFITDEDLVIKDYFHGNYCRFSKKSIKKGGFKRTKNKKKNCSFVIWSNRNI